MGYARSASLQALPLVLAFVVGGCDESTQSVAGKPDAVSWSREPLLDPKTCETCHPVHYRQWASSMHAYAAEDPVFLAMNRRGQRETDGALGDFCVRCHAPMAVREGITQDGLNLAEVPQHMRGVTCYFCHNVVSVNEHFNNGLELADDVVMRAGIEDPVENPVHDSQPSTLHDRNRPDSSLLCGSCHDVVTPAGVHLERTLQEYERSLFAQSGPGFETCVGCHMPGRSASVAPALGDHVPTRSMHEHLWPGVDMALTDFPGREGQRAAIECALGLNSRIVSVEHDGFGGFSIRVDTNAGHAQPSGAAQDRRLWLVVKAYDERGQQLFASGDVAADEVVDKHLGDDGYDPQLTVFRDWTFDAQANPTHMFWEVAPSGVYPEGTVQLTLPPAAQLGLPHVLEAVYQLPPSAVARLTVELRIRPIGLDVLQELVQSGDLDPALLDQVPTFVLQGAVAEWTPESGLSPTYWPERRGCPDDYLCIFDPAAPGCTDD